MWSTSGFSIGPLLFSLFIDDLPQVTRDVRIHMYADDVQLYFSRPIGLIEDCIGRINCDLTRVHAWATGNGLLLNPIKSRSIAFYGDILDLIDIPPITLSGHNIAVSSKITTLGITLNRDLRCCDHVRVMIGKVYAGVRRLWLSSAILSTETRQKLVKALIVPLFIYGSMIYPKLDSICARKVDVAFNDCIRFIYGLRRFDHVTPYKCLLLGCSLNSYLKRRALIFFYTLLKTGKPAYLREFFEFTTSLRNRNVLIPRFHNEDMESSYLVQIARLWNVLPSNVQDAGVVSAFRRLLETHLT